MASGGGAESKKQLKFYSYWRSSCSFRVRIALNLKGLDYEYIAINLLEGEQKSPEFLKLNPQGCVPVLVDGDIVVSDSFAILLKRSILKPIVAAGFTDKALNYQMGLSFRMANVLLKKAKLAANLVSANIQPYQNLPIIGYIKEKLGPDEMLAWVQHHLRKGFSALEKLLENYAGKYATGNEAFLADLFLAPQIDGAVRRFSIDMNEFPLLSKMNESYKEHPAFQDAMPGKQPDATS